MGLLISSTNEIPETDSQIQYHQLTPARAETNTSLPPLYNFPAQIFSPSWDSVQGQSVFWEAQISNKTSKAS